MSDSSKTVKRAQDTLSSIYSFYATNRESIENAPSFMNSSSREVPFIMRASNVPSAEKTEKLKAKLGELVKMQEAINNIPEAERMIMIEAANASTIRRIPKRVNTDPKTT